MVERTANDISLEKVSVYFQVPTGFVRAVDQVSAVFPGGQITGLIGESGCGKSVLGLAVLGLLPAYAQIRGDIFYGDINIAQASLRELRALRGREIGLIPQNPGESLNPVRRIGVQLEEALRGVEGNRGARRQKAESLLGRFGFADPKRIMAAYPFELSGGMQQRVLCALGISCTPRWVLADEPTKGLDLALREQVYENLLRVKEQGVEGMLIITHDLVLAETLCDGVAVMYSGEIVEWGQNSLREPLHPYTRAFLESSPGKGMKPLPGSPPAPWDNPPGCKFAPRCTQCTARCVAEKPEVYVRAGKMVRCFLYA